MNVNNEFETEKKIFFHSYTVLCCPFEVLHAFNYTKDFKTYIFNFLGLDVFKMNSLFNRWLTLKFDFKDELTYIELSKLNDYFLPKQYSKFCYLLP